MVDAMYQLAPTKCNVGGRIEVRRVCVCVCVSERVWAGWGGYNTQQRSNDKLTSALSGSVRSIIILISSTSGMSSEQLDSSLKNLLSRPVTVSGKHSARSSIHTPDVVFFLLQVFPHSRTGATSVTLPPPTLSSTISWMFTDGRQSRSWVYFAACPGTRTADITTWHVFTDSHWGGTRITEGLCQDVGCKNTLVYTIIYVSPHP